MAKQTDRAAAVEAWLVGTRFFPIVSQDDFDAAVAQFEAAIGRDKRYARAHGWLAYCHIVGVVDGWDLPKSVKQKSPEKIRDKARKLARKAVRLDPDDFDTHWALGYVLLHGGDPDGAEEHFRRARQLNFGNRELLVENADERVYAGDPDMAIELVMRARAIPDWQRWVLAWAYYFKGGRDPKFYDLALEELDLLQDAPGTGKAPAEILILKAALHAQKSTLGKGQGAASQLALAQDARAAYQALRSKRALGDFAATNPFRNAADRDHWLAGLKLAGF